MPYPDYGALLPAEALFEEPKAYAGVLKAEALKRASYLSSMDQFYEELEESTRRFEKSYILAEKEFEFGVEEAEWGREFKEKELAQIGELTGRELDIRERQVAAERFGITEEARLGEKALGLRREELEGELTGEEEFEMATEFLKEMFGAPSPTSAAGAYTPTREYLRDTEITLPTHPSEEHPEGWLAWLEETYPG